MGRKKKSATGKKSASTASLFSRIYNMFSTENPFFSGQLAVRIGFFALLAVGIVMFFNMCEGYVQSISQKRDLSLTVELKNPPDWLSPELNRDICLATGINRDDFLLDKSLTSQWRNNLAQNPWIKNVNNIHKRFDGRVVLDCDIRRPLAIIENQGRNFYIDVEGMVMPYQPTNGHLVRLRGHQSESLKPGESIHTPELIAGIEVLQLILQVDENLPMGDRLWTELAILDVSNFQGRQDALRSQLTLYTKGNTEVRWGAPVGNYIAFKEASDKLKLTTLYREFKQTGSLDHYQYVELRNHRKEKADPLRLPQNG